jgi:hypothetical protein
MNPFALETVRLFEETIAPTSVVPDLGEASETSEYPHQEISRKVVKSLELKPNETYCFYLPQRYVKAEWYVSKYPNDP